MNACGDSRLRGLRSRKPIGFRQWVVHLGVGYNTPGIIKYPFWQMTNTFEHAFYVCLNQREAYVPDEIMRKSVCMNEDIGEVLKEL